MANARDIEFAYTLIDRVFRLALGDAGDFSGAMYNGDFTLTLEQAQRQKHAFIQDQLRLTPNSRFLDMTCGWGPLLTYLKSQNIPGIGTTLSSGQAKSCQRRGLDVRLMDCRKITPETFGQFDAVASVGGWEHFCSIQEYLDGKQDEIYANNFRRVADLLPRGSRFFLQTMVFGRNMIAYDQISLNQSRDSNSFILALLQKQFPGSWLPYGSEQLEKNASPYFKTVFKSSGRLDYIQTIDEWTKRFRRFSFKKYVLYFSLLPRYVFDKNFRLGFCTGINANQISFERELLDHFRVVFERI